MIINQSPYFIQISLVPHPDTTRDQRVMSLWLWRVFFIPAFHIVDSLERYQAGRYLRECLIKWVCLMFLSWSGKRPRFWRGSHWGKRHFEHGTSKMQAPHDLSQLAMTLIAWLRSRLTCLSSAKSFFSAPFRTVRLGRKPHPRSGSYFWNEGIISTLIMQNFPAQEICFSPPFIHFFNHLL